MASQADISTAIKDLLATVVISIFVIIIAVAFIGFFLDGGDLIGAIVGATIGTITYRLFDKKFRKNFMLVWHYARPDHMPNWTKNIKLSGNSNVKVTISEEEPETISDLKKSANKSLLDD